MLDNFYLLKEVSKFLEKEITGFHIEEIFTQEKDKLVLALSDNSDICKYIEFSCKDKLPYLFIKDDYKKAKRNVMNLMPGLYEQEIRSVSIFNNDRIIKAELSDNMYLYFVFFKLKSNVLVAADGKIIDAFQNKKELIGISINDFVTRKEEARKKKESNLKEYYRSTYRRFGDIPLKEFLYISNMSGNEELDEQLKNNIDTYVSDYEIKLESPVYLLYKNDKNYYLSFIKLEHLKDYEITEFKDVNELVLGYLKNHYQKFSGEDLKKKVLQQKENEFRGAEKKYLSLNKQLEVAGNAGQLKVYGDLILVNLHLINKGDEVFTLSGDEYPEKIEIALKRELSPAENAEMYYDRYKRQKNSVDLLKEKMEVQKNNLEYLRKEIEDLKNNKDLKAFKMTEKENPKDDETSRFRKFRLDDKFEVWVGKDSASNDMLTVRYSAQNDLWFHVRGASGSHTVLKISDKKNPPEKRIIQTAASIAAYYSKARNASNVPVAYCERKYVKKKKGFKEGSVIMEREKVIFVKPGLPEYAG